MANIVNKIQTKFKFFVYNLPGIWFMSLLNTKYISISCSMPKKTAMITEAIIYSLQSLPLETPPPTVTFRLQFHPCNGYTFQVVLLPPNTASASQPVYL